MFRLSSKHSLIFQTFRLPPSRSTFLFLAPVYLKDVIFSSVMITNANYLKNPNIYLLFTMYLYQGLYMYYVFSLYSNPVKYVLL